MLLSLIPGAIVHVGMRGPFWSRLFASLSVCVVLPFGWAIYYSQISSRSFGELITSEPIAFWVSLLALIWLPGILFYEYARIKGSRYRHFLGILAAIVFPVLSLVLFLPAFHKIFPPKRPGVVIQSNVNIDPVTGLPSSPVSYNFPDAVDENGNPLAYFSGDCRRRIEDSHMAGKKVITINEVCPNE